MITQYIFDDISIKGIHLKNLQSFINPLKMIISKIYKKKKMKKI